MKSLASKTLPTLLLVLALAIPGRACAAQVERAEILWAGTYTAEILGTVEQPETASGRTNKLGAIRKLETTTTVRGRLGTSFGFEYALIGTPAGSQAEVEIVVLLPEPGLTNPATGKRTLRERWRPSPSVLGGATIAGYQFEMDWEIVTGVWKFEIWSGGRRLGAQSFCVVPDGEPDPGPDATAKRGPCHSAATA